ncbi:MAG: hypothetical protein C0626_00180 [Arcobacter sp.]|uniref:hypothetical protein n=1 Tax=uncultured Arcobacter sp. TaxID=165434 RepID=UPI000CB90462|nr:hypothetical protein [uncultured Arcobacter sp.]PLY11027.1 MAG: hypothetical protein C0626_00180 [Arcobacter sp.]
MVLDMNIELEGIDEEFLENFEELIEDTRVEYFIINPKTKEDVEKAQALCCEYERFKYTLPINFYETKDNNCVAIRVSNIEELETIENMPVIIDSKTLDDEFIDVLNNKAISGVVLEAKQSDNRLHNFAYAISYDSLKDWTKEGLTDTDYNKLALQSNYPKYSYDDLFDLLLKDMSDLTFRAEQSIASGGTRTVLKIFKLL